MQAWRCVAALRQDMPWNDVGADRASGRFANSLDGVAAAIRASGNVAGTIELDIRREVIGKIDGRPVGQLMFQGELVGRRINLPEVVDAGVATTRGA